MEQSTSGLGGMQSTNGYPSSHSVGVAQVHGALTEQAWCLEPAYIVGGGPSLKGFDWKLLEGVPHVIAINRAFVDCPTAEIFFTEDARFITRFAVEYPVAWKRFQGRKLWHCLNEGEIPEVMAVAPDVEIIRKKREDKFWSYRFSDGLSYSSNSAVGAINIAHILQADPIYLLGIDCRTTGLRMENYHQDYRKDPMWEVGANAADTFKGDMEGWVAPHVRDTKIISLINPVMPTALECWPKRTYLEHWA